MNKYSFFCDHCSFRKIINNPEDLDIFVIIPSSPIQKTIPQIDSLTKKLKMQSMNQPKKLKCPKCGFSNRPKIIKEEAKNDNIDN